MMEEGRPMRAKASRARWDGLDTLRGVTLVSMIAYHACWDLAYIFRVNMPWYGNYAAYLWQQSICWTFLLLSGYCFHLGHHRLQRGLVTFGCGALVSAVTWLFMPEDRVFFGVLSLLGAAQLLTVLLDPLLRRIPPRAGLVASFSLFLLCREVNSGYLGFAGEHLLTLPTGLYHDLLTVCLGFPPAGFFSTDYFPLLPWLFLFLTGYFLFPLRQEDPPRLRLPGVTVMGRHSLLLYLLHQPLVYGTLCLLFLSAG
jgi:uncharacterized membrane protein